VDVELIARVREGDHAAFTELYTRAYAPVFRFVYLRVKSRDEAEDITQDVFVKVFQSPPQSLPAHGSILPFLFTLARNRVVDWSRRQRPVASDEALANLVDEEPTADAFIDLALEERRVLTALTRLSESDEAVLKLKYLDGMPTGAIASLLNKTEEAVRQALSRALGRLRSLLDGEPK
jgi:RNA polymerase sigma-70 factor (ECF subfamily)